MAAQVVPLQPLRLPAGPSSITPEQRYWRSFRSQQLIPSPHSSPVTHISYPPSSLNGATSSPDTFAVTSGNRIRIFSSRSRKLLKTISRFGVEDIAHGGEMRPDSRVLAAGGDSGTILVFDINSRAILKTWKEHKQPVWTVKWSPTDLTSLMSTSDDRTVRLWDLPTGDSVKTFAGHQDYVRSGCFMSGHGSSLLVSGSYDQTVRLWDTRTSDGSVMTFKHNAPVESVLPMPSSTMLLASADNQISVLDLVAARPLEIIKSHQKTVTCLSLASNGTRVVSGSLDGHVKIFETTGWRVVSGSKYSSPILSLSVIPGGSQKEDRHIAVGMQSGLFSLKTRLSGQQKVQERERAKEMQALVEGKIEEYDKKKAKKHLPQGIRKRLRGLDYEGEGVKIIIEGRERFRKKKLPEWNQHLRAARYGQALDVALAQQPPDPTSVLTLFTALQHRSALRTALLGRDETSLEPVLKWLTKHITDPRHVVLTTRVSTLVLELYSEHLGQSKMVDRLVERLHDRVRDQVEGSQVAENTRGMLEMIMAGG